MWTSKVPSLADINVWGCEAFVSNVLKTGFLIEPVGWHFPVQPDGQTGSIFLYVFNYPAYIDYKTCHLFSITNVNRMQHIKTIIIEVKIKQRSPKQTQKSKNVRFNPVHSGSIQLVEPVFFTKTGWFNPIKKSLSNRSKSNRPHLRFPVWPVQPAGSNRFLKHWL